MVETFDLHVGSAQGFPSDSNQIPNAVDNLVRDKSPHTKLTLECCCSIIERRQADVGNCLIGVKISHADTSLRTFEHRGSPPL